MMSGKTRFAVITFAAILFVVFSFAIYVNNSWAGDAARGKKIFFANCVVCHGEKGNGQGPAAATMDPKPRNFTSKSEMKGIDEARLRKSITEGRPGTAMVSFAKTLSKQDIEDVIAYIKTLGGYQGD